MRKLYLIPLFAAFAFTSKAQVNSINHCGHTFLAKQMAEDHPERATTVSKSKTSTSPTNLQKDLDEVYIVPVVFHVIHNNGPENISDEQLLDALRILNRDFRAQNPDTAWVATPFQGLPADAKIEFRLALRAPDGTCFNGITRTVSEITNGGMGAGMSMVQAVIDGNNVYNGIWPHYQYMNVIVANDISAAGYTYYPNEDATPTFENMYYNSIFLLADYTGSIGTSNEMKSRVLTHETGHWLNLAHIWGDGSVEDFLNCGPDIDDYIEDTPDCTGTFNCDVTLNSCEDDDEYWGFPMVDNVENYMEYAYCSKMFTLGQTMRMRDALNSDIGGRLNLWTEENLEQTGILGGVSLCNISFEADRTALCSGASINFAPSTTDGIATYSWSFPGGSPSFSTASNPTVTYPADGNYDVYLSVTSLLDGTYYSAEKLVYISVGSNTPVFDSIGPFCVGDQVASLPLTSLNGINGTWNPSVIDDQVSQDYTFTPAIGECATAYVASVTINSLPDVTINTLPQICVDDLPFQLTQGSPANGGYFGDGIVGGYFLPASAGPGTTNFTYTFTNSFGCSASANIQFEVLDCLGLNELNDAELSIYPNPSTGKMTIALEGNPILSYSIIDLNGKCLMEGNKTGNKVELDLSAFSNGYYVIEVTTTTSKYRNSVVIQK